MNDTLEFVLADLYPTIDDQQRVLDDIGFDRHTIKLNSSAINVWDAVLKKLYYDKATFYKLVILTGNTYNILEKLMGLYEDFIQQHTQDRLQHLTVDNNDMKNQNDSIVLSQMRIDIKNIKNELDSLSEFKLDTTVRLTKIETKLEHLDETLDEIHKVQHDRKVDSDTGRLLLYLILAVLVILILVGAVLIFTR